eukprot:1981168-Pyramimonas_sp.AAC.1
MFGNGHHINHHARERARVGGASCTSPLGGHGKPYVNLNIQYVTAKVPLQFPGQHGDCSIVDCGQ